ncbi:MAG: response regulator, partial [Pseudobdellovibrionaceae bacterium]
PFVQNHATAQLKNVSQQADFQIRGMIQKTETIVRIGRDLGINGTFTLDDPDRFHQITASLIQQDPHLSSIILADEYGREILVSRTSDRQWMTRQTDPAKWGATAQLKFYDNYRQLLKEEAVNVELDPRTSAWFQKGMSLASDQNIHWMEPTVLSFTQEPSFSAIVRWTDPQGIKNVLSTGLKFMDLSRLTQSLGAGQNGFVAVLSAEGAWLGLPRSSRFDSEIAVKAAVLKPFTEAGLLPLNEAYRLWRDQGSVDGKLISFRTEGQPWLAIFHRTDLGPYPAWVASLAPEADFYPALPELLSMLLALILTAMLLTWLFAALFAKRFSKPLAHLAAEGARLADQRDQDREIQFVEDSKKSFEKEPVPIPIFDDSSLHLSHAKVLLVEADPLNRDLTAAMLKEGGLAVDIAGNGQIAIEKIIQNHYDAVLIDLQMPVMDGLTATHLIRKNPAYRKLPIIALTANVMRADLDRCRQAGMNDHISKPIDAARMWQVLKKWIPLQSHPQSQERTSVKETAYVIPNLSRLPGLDFKGSVRRLGGRESSYLKVLQVFLRDHIHAVEDIQRSLQNENRSLTLQQLQILKGVAGQIGAHFVEADVILLEKALQSQGSASAIESHAKNLALHFGMLIKQLDENLPPSD